MGEYAEMMLDGTCCCNCGEFLGDGEGFTAYCNDCDPAPIHKTKSVRTKAPKLKKTIQCSHAGCLRKFVNEEAVKQHLRHFHKVYGLFKKVSP